MLNQIDFSNLNKEYNPEALPIPERTGNIKKQMIYANKKKVKFVVIFGETEAVAKNIIIKNMEDGSQQQVDIDKLLDFI